MATASGGQLPEPRLVDRSPDAVAGFLIARRGALRRGGLRPRHGS